MEWRTKKKQLSVAGFFPTFFAMKEDTDKGKYFCPKNRQDWRQWLEENGAKERKVWLLYSDMKKGRTGISYFDALSEALCFGWIDGRFKRFSAEYLSQRFTPRRKNSNWSEVNRELARRLLAQKLMTPAGMAVLPDLNPDTFVMAEDILDELKKDPEVWRNFCAFPKYYQIIRVASVEKRRHRPSDQFQRSLRYLISKTKKNTKFGPLT